MYKLISFYQSASNYPANARIVQVTPREYALYIKHDVVGTVLYRRGFLCDRDTALFSFIPTGHTRPIVWKKVKSNGD